MKIIGLCVAVLITFFAKSQLSYDFANPLPPEGKNITLVSKPQFGIYSSGQVDIDYEFNAQGVFAISIIFNSISRKTIRESSQFSLKDGFLFGVTGSDSIPCELQGEYYHFGIKFKEQIIGGTSKNILTRIDPSTYIINFEDKEHYTPSLLVFKGKKLSVQHFTYEDSTTFFDTISLRTEIPSTQLTYITLDPTLEEWNSLSFTEILGTKIEFER